MNPLELPSPARVLAMSLPEMPPPDWWLPLLQTACAILCTGAWLLALGSVAVSPLAWPLFRAWQRLSAAGRRVF